MRDLLWSLWNDPKSVRKFIAALLTVAISAVALGAFSGPVATTVGLLAVFCNALGVYAVRNDEGRKPNVQA